MITVQFPAHQKRNWRGHKCSLLEEALRSTTELKVPSCERKRVPDNMLLALSTSNNSMGHGLQTESRVCRTMLAMVGITKYLSELENNSQILIATLTPLWYRNLHAGLYKSN
ncbi:hypothetical protein ACJMK2_025342 [Sinanodonta woodiana]|uniref:Uncharacterized protein n=1 Tax=Sinanodonta woodiana TaxID=1069815 RepID=A0ABD3XG69_SINWO